MARTAAGEKKKKKDSLIRELLRNHKTICTLNDKDLDLLKQHCSPILQEFGLSKKVTMAEIMQEITLPTQLLIHTRFTTPFINVNKDMQPLLRACAAYVDSQIPQANPAPTVLLVPTAEDARVLKAQAERNFLIQRHGDMPTSTHRQLLANVFATRLPCKVDGRLVVAVHGEHADKENQWLLISAILCGGEYKCVWIQRFGHTLKLVRNSCLPKDLTLGN